MAVIIGTLIAAILVWALSVGAWFGIYTLLIYLLSLVGIIDFNIIYAAILTVATVIINAFIRAFRSNRKNDD